MKKNLLKTSAIALLLSTSISKAQVTNFDANAFGFESTNVAWTSGGTHNGATSPGNIVDAWTQVDGFEQSSAVARTGTYSMLADFSTTIPSATPKLQTWRSNTDKEGNFDYDSDAGTNVNYTISGYVYVDIATDGAFKIASQKSGGQTASVTIQLSTATPGTWTPFSASFDFTESDGTAYWTSMNFASMPTTNSKIYIDDVAIVETSTLSTAYTNKIEGALVSSLNGSVTVSGAILEGVYSITGKKLDNSNLPNGVYIVKISKGNQQEAVKVVM